MIFPTRLDPQRLSDTDKLCVAFGVYIAQQIVEADGLLDADELKLLTTVFPDELLTACGFLSSEGELTDVMHNARDEAIASLRMRLDLNSKLELVTFFHDTCVADGELHEKEFEILIHAASALGVTTTQLRGHLGSLQGMRTPVPPVRRGD